MPTTRRHRVLDAGPQEVWDVVADPHHLPRWWPRVQRVEAVDRDHWTQVFMTGKGKPVRADYRLISSQAPVRRTWAQEVEGTPFERVLREATTEIEVRPGPGAATEVAIAVTQRLRGFARLGGFMVRRATGRLLDEALEGLGAACER